MVSSSRIPGEQGGFRPVSMGKRSQNTLPRKQERLQAYRASRTVEHRPGTITRVYAGAAVRHTRTVSPKSRVTRVPRRASFRGTLLRPTLLAPVFLSSFLILLLLSLGLFDDLLLRSGPADVTFAHENLEPSGPVEVMKASVGLISAGNTWNELVFTRHRVGKKETIARIAYEYGLSPSTLISVNRLDSGDSGEIESGTQLIVPYRDGFRVSPEQDEGPLELAARYGTESSLVQIIPGTGDFFISGTDVREQDAGTTGGDVFHYPVTGRVITAYGTGIDSLTGIAYESEGIDLAAGDGTPVTAGMDGTVILTGHHASYGRYVMISHPGGWKSFYGHLASIEVVPGDNLETGEGLGTVGQSGTARSPRLHFAIFHGGEPVDPLDYLY